MRFNLFFIRTLSVFAMAIVLAGSSFAQGKGNKGGGGGGKHDGGPPGQQKHADRGGDRGGGQGQGQFRQEQRQVEHAQRQPS